ncbi:hypothetical protein NM688_g4602 [Phlebia brevispora]|uniref:Uncharacterized protein n=1 Tax=Phlebia brevispora TaxID=194682 RepID=A0ACC1T2S7_9APHY|nr:hypothetical protein NM688_g4602 [Phlebia brevispora]
MSLNLGGSQRGTKGKDETATSENSSSWNAVEKSMLKYDSGMIEDFADDINTLLVFAGLFSAVVTAFVIVSYTMLQPDNTQLSVQLLSVLAIRAGGSTGSNSFLNSTAATLPSSIIFRASAAAISINALWFTSLVLSLASALYGILAKQWCREYLKWNAVLSDPSENVLVRQMRVEAWMQWKVPLLIAAIPALLEVALILFLSGMIIFFWTLETTVAAILTALIGILLAVAVAVTILPVFAPHCPYRSTTGWALLKCWNFFVRVWRKSQLPDNWRGRELEVLNGVSQLTQSIDGLGFSPSYLSTAQAAYARSTQVGIRLRALSWTYQDSSSSNAQLSDDIMNCIPSFHDTPSGISDSPTLNLLSSLLAVSTICGTELSLREAFGDPFTSEFRLWSVEMGKFVASYSFRTPDAEYHQFGSPSPFLSHPLICTGNNSEAYLWPARRLLMEDLRRALPVSSADSWFQEDNNARLLVLVLCLLRSHGTSDSAEYYTKCRLDLIDIMSTAYRALGPIKAAYQTGVIPMMMEVLCLSVHRISVDIHTYHVFDEGPPYLSYFPPIMTFALEVFRQNQEYSRPNERHLFVMAADAVLRYLIDDRRKAKVVISEFTTEESEAVGRVFIAMTAAAQISLDKGYKNFGAYVHLPWLSSLIQLFDNRWPHSIRRHNTLSLPLDAKTGIIWLQGIEDTFLQLISLLQKNVEAGLITSKNRLVGLDFHTLLTIVGSPKLPPASQYDLSRADSMFSTFCTELGMHAEATQVLPAAAEPTRDGEGSPDAAAPGRVLPVDLPAVDQGACLLAYLEAIHRLSRTIQTPSSHCPELQPERKDCNPPKVAMPLSVGRRRRSRDGEAKHGNKMSAPTGWAAVEESTLSYDDEMISDFADDIDTLLVFAGLFSAIVTAFVIVSFVMLQPDNTQLSVQLLAVVAIRSGGFPGSDSFLNSTAATLPISTSFQAPPSAIAINALWFTSLWCRDYLKWNAVFSDARENVLVRQIRFELWERWKVSAFIVAIPALLEVALVLFLAGMIIFLWTLESTVAIILTIIIGLSLGVALAATVLPVFYVHCPYRTPTGWAFLKLWKLVCRLWQKSELPEDWRRRELEVLGWIPSITVPLDGAVLGFSVSGYSDSVWPSSIQVGIHLRALSWAYQGSGGTNLTDDIVECVSSLHSDSTGPFDPALNLLSSFLALYVVSPTGLAFEEAFINPLCRRLSLPNTWGLTVSYTFRIADDDYYRNDYPPPFLHHPFLPTENSSDTHQWLTRRLFIEDLRYLIATLASQQQWWLGSDDTVKLIVLVLCLLRCHGVGSAQHYAKTRQDLMEILSTVYKVLGPFDTAYESGLIPMVAEMLCLLVGQDSGITVNIDTCNVEIIETPPLDLAEPLVSFAVQVFEQNPDYSRPNERHLFVMAVDAVLRRLIQDEKARQASSVQFLSVEVTTTTFSCMVSAAQLSLTRSYPNCGAYVGVPWLSSFVQLFVQYRSSEQRFRSSAAQIADIHFMKNIAHIFLQLLSLLKESIQADLITGERTREDFDVLLELVGNPELPPVLYDWVDDYVPSAGRPDLIRHAKIIDALYAVPLEGDFTDFVPSAGR